MLLTTGLVDTIGKNVEAMADTDGWSKTSVEGKSVMTVALRLSTSSVELMESSPADISDTSFETAVPTSDAIVIATVSMKPSDMTLAAAGPAGVGLIAKAGYFKSLHAQCRVLRFFAHMCAEFNYITGVGAAV